MILQGSLEEQHGVGRELIRGLQQLCKPLGIACPRLFEPESLFELSDPYECGDTLLFSTLQCKLDISYVEQNRHLLSGAFRISFRISLAVLEQPLIQIEKLAWLKRSVGIELVF